MSSASLGLLLTWGLWVRPEKLIYLQLWREKLPPLALKIDPSEFRLHGVRRAGCTQQKAAVNAAFSSIF